MSPLEPYRLRPLEVASGLVLGDGEESPELPQAPAELTPLAALEEAILPALLRPPCLVSFSGGRDSSAILALAAHVARREGLPLPVPATHRFPGADGAGESEWQEQVVAHLGIRDWIRVNLTDELDCVGPVATAVLERHGLLWPSNAHFHVPLLEEAAGGSLLTGIGGDEAFTTSTWKRTLAVLEGRARPVPRDLLRVGFAFAPRPVRSLVLRGRIPPVSFWLVPAALRSVRASLAAEAAREPLGWQRRFRWLHGLHYLRVGMRSLAVLAEDAGAAIAHPFSSGRFLAALGGLPPELRYQNRTAAMKMLFAGVLPEAVIERRTKARFDGAFWTEHSRELVARWSGEGVDAELVDLDVLRAEWASEEPDARTFTLLQAVALELRGAGSDVAGRDGEQTVRGRFDRGESVRTDELPRGERRELQQGDRIGRREPDAAVLEEAG